MMSNSDAQPFGSIGQMSGAELFHRLDLVLGPSTAPSLLHVQGLGPRDAPSCWEWVLGAQHHCLLPPTPQNWVLGA